MINKLFDLFYNLYYFFLKTYKYYLKPSQVDLYYLTNVNEIYLIENEKKYYLNLENLNALNKSLEFFFKINFNELIDQICKSNNIKELNDDSYIFINYQVKNRSFYLCKKTKNIINKYYTSYSMKNLQNICTNYISFAQFKDIDCTNLLKMYSGPLQNFYKNTDYEQYLNEIYDPDENKFLFSNNDDEILIISDLLLNDYEYSKPFDKIIKLKNDINDDNLNFSNNFNSKVIENRFKNFKFSIDKKHFYNTLKGIFNSFNKKLR